MFYVTPRTKVNGNERPDLVKKAETNKLTPGTQYPVLHIAFSDSLREFSLLIANDEGKFLSVGNNEVEFAGQRKTKE